MSRLTEIIDYLTSKKYPSQDNYFHFEITPESKEVRKQYKKDLKIDEILPDREKSDENIR